MLRLLQKTLHFKKSLTKQQATIRRLLIRPQSTQYSFHICLHPGTKYNGLMQMKFDLNQSNISNDTYLDFQGQSVGKIFINNQMGGDQLYDKEMGKIKLPKEFLNQKDNYVTVGYQCQYDMDGSGCVSFTDVDNKQYLYTQFQPYMANRVFPMFDQPDLKAKMKLAIAYPESWQTAISNQPIQQQISMSLYNRSFLQIHSKFMQPTLPQKYLKIRQQILTKYYQNIPSTHKLSSFKQTCLLPSYLYCFVVGPYIRLSCSSTYKNIPMSLYCIESLSKQLQILRPLIQQSTNLSMQFFQSYFGYPYPFSKYDQVFAHQYKWGAMENAGVVTLNDLYLFKNRVSNERMFSFVNTIVHQLAHHWFGNLVTMRWWDDLWLNQSFAQYISHFCLEKIKKNVNTLDYQSAMMSFYIRKGWGYNQDQLITTHPITGQVKNTHVAQSIFDGITYSKGAAVMKQLMYLIGEQNFSKALKQYFNKYAFKNTQLDDLLECITKYFPEMKEWKQMWLQKAGSNTLSCSINNTNHTLTIEQSPTRSQHPTLRIHNLLIAYITPSGLISQPITINPVTSQTIQIPQNIQPLAVLLNYNDLAYAKIRIDQKSYKYYQENLSQVKDSLFRVMVWRTLYQMVRDANIITKHYVKFAINNLPHQVSDTILEEQLSYIHISINQYVPFNQRQSLFTEMFDFLKIYLVDLPETNINRITILKDKLISFAYTQSQKQFLLLWFKSKVPQFASQIKSLNTSQKWKALLKIFTSKSLSTQTKKEIFSSQQQIDKSDVMLKRKITCNLLLQTNISTLLSTYNSLLSPSTQTSTSIYSYTIQGLNSSIHKEFLISHLRQLYFKNLKQMLEQTNKDIQLRDQFKEEFMHGMDTVTDDNQQDLVTKIYHFKQIQPKNDKLRVLLLKKIDQLQRRIKAYKFYSENK